MLTNDPMKSTSTEPGVVGCKGSQGIKSVVNTVVICPGNPVYC